MTHLSTRLREGTQHSHTAAENTAFMKCFMKGIVEREPLRKLSLISHSRQQKTGKQAVSERLASR
jgi:heme oxygenase